MCKRRHATTAAGTLRLKTLKNINDRFTTIDDSSLSKLRRSCSDPLDHPDLAALQAASGEVLGWILEQFLTLEKLPVGQTASVAQMEALLREPAPDLGQGFDFVFDEFKRKVAPYAVRIDHPRFLAFVPTAPTFISI